MTPRQAICSYTLSRAGNDETNSDIELFDEDADAIVGKLKDAGYVIVPREPPEEAIAKADAALLALPPSETVVQGPRRLRTLRHAWRLIIEAAEK